MRNNFYLYLSAVISVLILLDAGIFHIGENMRDRAFDLMVKNRIPALIAKPDQDIVIVDINEASLSALAQDFGRWPWPRQVFGEFVENIQAQNPKAIVFDILFSDPDIYNPDSDEYFNEVIAGTVNTYFPMVRLAPESDNLSEITPDTIIGLTKTPESTNLLLEKKNVITAKTLAIVLPFFESIKNSGRLGTNNIYQDADGIVRQYRLWEDHAGWRVPALPLVVGSLDEADLTNYSETLPQNMLINWRGKPFSYQTVSFSDVYNDMASAQKNRPENEFTNKIVIIGSTAPSLFDVKATAIAKAHPGVEILATAIDNVKHADYLKVWRGKIPYILMSLVLVWLTATAFYRSVDRDKLITLFSLSQIGLLAISFATINFTNTYLDITGPITWAILYFSIAKIYSFANERAMQRILASNVTSGAHGSAILMMPISLENQESLSDSQLKKIQQAIRATTRHNPNVDILKGSQSGIWGLFSDLITVSWAYQPEDAKASENTQQEANQLASQLKTIAQTLGLPNDGVIRYSQHTGAIHTDNISADQLSSQWRGLFAQAILKLDVLESEPFE